LGCDLLSLYAKDSYLYCAVVSIVLLTMCMKQSLERTSVASTAGGTMAGGTVVGGTIAVA